MTKKDKVVAGVKGVGGLVSSAGAQALACGLCRLVLPPGVHVIAKGGFMLGGLLLGGFIGEKLNAYMDEQIDQAVKNIEDTTSEVKRCLDVIQDKNEEPATE